MSPGAETNVGKQEKVTGVIAFCLGPDGSLGPAPRFGKAKGQDQGLAWGGHRPLARNHLGRWE